MGLIRTWNEVPFFLELLVKHNSREPEKFYEEVGKVRRTLTDNYPKIRVGEQTIICGHYGGTTRGPALIGKTDPKTFRELFGPNIARGFSFSYIPFFLNLPSEAYFKWYQTGELKIPEKLDGLVDKVYFSRYAMGSFREVDVTIPVNAIHY